MEFAKREQLLNLHIQLHCEHVALLREHACAALPQREQLLELQIEPVALQREDERAALLQSHRKRLSELVHIERQCMDFAFQRKRLALQRTYVSVYAGWNKKLRELHVQLQRDVALESEKLAETANATSSTCFLLLKLKGEPRKSEDVSQERIYLLTFDQGKPEFNRILNTSPHLEPFRQALRKAELPLELQEEFLKGVRLFVPPYLYHAAKVLLQEHKEAKNLRFYSRHVVVSDSTRSAVIQSLGKFGKLKRGGKVQIGVAGSGADESDVNFREHLDCLRESGLEVTCTFLGEARHLLERQEVANSTIPRCDTGSIPSGYINPRRRVLALLDRAPQDRQPGDGAESIRSRADSEHSWATFDPWEHADDAESVSSQVDSMHSWVTFNSER